MRCKTICSEQWSCDGEGGNIELPNHNHTTCDHASAACTNNPSCGSQPRVNVQNKLTLYKIHFPLTVHSYTHTHTCQHVNARRQVCVCMCMLWKYAATIHILWPRTSRPDPVSQICCSVQARHSAGQRQRITVCVWVYVRAHVNVVRDLLN